MTQPEPVTPLSLYSDIFPMDSYEIKTIRAVPEHWCTINLDNNRLDNERLPSTREINDADTDRGCKCCDYAAENKDTKYVVVYFKC